MLGSPKLKSGRNPKVKQIFGHTEKSVMEVLTIPYLVGRGIIRVDPPDGWVDGAAVGH